MSYVVDIGMATPDPEDEYRNGITVERPDEVEAVVTAAIQMLAPYGELLRTRAGLVQHLIGLLLPYAPTPNLDDYRLVDGGDE